MSFPSDSLFGALEKKKKNEMKMENSANERITER